MRDNRILGKEKLPQATNWRGSFHHPQTVSMSKWAKRWIRYATQHTSLKSPLRTEQHTIIMYEDNEQQAVEHDWIGSIWFLTDACGIVMLNWTTAVVRVWKCGPTWVTASSRSCRSGCSSPGKSSPCTESVETLPPNGSGLHDTTCRSPAGNTTRQEQTQTHVM